MSWWQLKAIADEAKQERERFRNEPPSACPRCGEPLLNNAQGVLHCKFDGFTYQGGGAPRR